MDMTTSTIDIDADLLKEIQSLGTIHTTWRDYTLLLLNSTSDPLRSIWREKIVTSFVHWNFLDGSISEGNVVGMAILASLPSDFTQMVVDDSFAEDEYELLGRLSGSKRMKVFVGHYPQESLSNEANTCIKYIVENWEDSGFLIFNNPMLKRIWDFAQISGGNAVSPDEVLTYAIEKPVNGGVEDWIDVSIDVFANGIPSDKYKEYWRAEKIEGFPLPVSEDLEVQKNNFLNTCETFLKEDVAYSPCWKKVAICILKNDVSMKYAGFGATLREREAREDAIAAFDTKEKQKEASAQEAKRMAAEIEAKNKEE